MLDHAQSFSASFRGFSAEELLQLTDVAKCVVVQEGGVVVQEDSPAHVAIVLRCATKEGLGCSPPASFGPPPPWPPCPRPAASAAPTPPRGGERTPLRMALTSRAEVGATAAALTPGRRGAVDSRTCARARAGRCFTSSLATCWAPLPCSTQACGRALRRASGAVKLTRPACIYDASQSTPRRC